MLEPATLNDRPARISQPQQLRHFVVGFPGSVVTGAPDEPISPAPAARLACHLAKIKMSVASRHNQSQHWKFKFTVTALPLFEQYCMDVPFQMIHRDQRLLQRKGQGFGIGDSDQ